VRRLEEVVIATLAEFGVAGQLDPSAIGIWTPEQRGQGQQGGLAKICALGGRIRRGVSMHGIALNVTTDLRYFNLIVPCGLTGRAVTSMREVMGQKTPAMEAVKEVLKRKMVGAFGE
jgi:lipoyl(octanoyl) transferase